MSRIPGVVPTPPPRGHRSIDQSSTIALSPDGAHVVYVGNGGTQLLVRQLDALEPIAIYTGSPISPFVSLDGQWVGFFEGVILKKVP
jgi:hypothetical protein